MRTRRGGSWPPTTSTSWRGTTSQDAGRTWADGEDAVRRSHPHWARTPLAYRDELRALAGRRGAGHRRARPRAARGRRADVGADQLARRVLAARAASVRLPRPARRRGGLRHREGGQAGPGDLRDRRRARRARRRRPGLRRRQGRANVAAAIEFGLDGICSPAPTTSARPCASAACRSEPPCGSRSSGWAWRGRRWPACWPTAGSTSWCSSRRTTRGRSAPGSGCSTWASRCWTGSGCWRRCAPSRARCPGSTSARRRGAGWSTCRTPTCPARCRRSGCTAGTLFSLLLSAVRKRGVPIELGVRVTGVRPVPGGLAVETPAGDHGIYDLVVGCDGSRSPVRRSMGVAVRDHAYDYGALWSIVDDPDGLGARRAVPVPARHPAVPRRAADRPRPGLGVLVRARLDDAGRARPAACRPGATPPGRWPASSRRSSTGSTTCCPPPTATSSCARRTGWPTPAARRPRRRRRARDEPAARHRHLARARRRLDPAPRPGHRAVPASGARSGTPPPGPRTSAGTSGGPG